MQSENLVLPVVVEIGDVYTYLKELDSLSEALYKTGGTDFDELLKTAVSGDLHHAVIESCNRNGGGSSAEFKKTIIEQLKTALKSIPIVRLEVAVIPSLDAMKRIQSWVKLNLHDPVVLEFVADPGVMGGARISFMGKYADKSLASRWKVVWEEAVRELWSGKNNSLFPGK